MAGATYEIDDRDLLDVIKADAKAAAAQLIEAAHLKKGQIVVIGCSTSEVVGKSIGKYSTPEVGNAIYEGLNSEFGPKGIYIAAQCCEHLNRAIIVVVVVVVHPLTLLSPDRYRPVCSSPTMIDHKRHQHKQRS